MTDKEFIQAIKDRLAKCGWQTGRIGTFDGPNCIVGAAGFVQHGSTLEVDEQGVNPLVLDGKILDDENSYDNIPGMVRLAKILNERHPMGVSWNYNDGHDTLEEVLGKVDTRIEELTSFHDPLLD
jgi:hypothetical protein